jgi:hypothetical protein
MATPSDRNQEKNMTLKSTVLLVAMSVALGSCSTVVTSNAIAPSATAWTGQVLVSEAPAPTGLEYKVVGSVQADARAGYDSVVALYPLLAAEAKKLGANAVVSAKGGHHVSAFSWAAPYVTGLAIHVDDPQKLKAIPGAYY